MCSPAPAITPASDGQEAKVSSTFSNCFSFFLLVHLLVFNHFKWSFSCEQCVFFSFIEIRARPKRKKRRIKWQSLIREFWAFRWHRQRIGWMLAPETMHVMDHRPLRWTTLHGNENDILKAESNKNEFIVKQKKPIISNMAPSVCFFQKFLFHFCFRFLEKNCHNNIWEKQNKQTKTYV